LLRDAIYRRLWTSILISSFGGQVTLLALPLSAAVLLHAAPTQMGLLTAMEIAPFVLFSLPTGVWLDRVRKLPVYVVGELSIAVTVAPGKARPPALTVPWYSEAISAETATHAATSRPRGLPMRFVAITHKEAIVPVIVSFCGQSFTSLTHSLPDSRTII